MWKIKGDLAENTETGSVIRINMSRDGLFRVKRNYKTVGAFKTLAEARDYLVEVVTKYNNAD